MSTVKKKDSIHVFLRERSPNYGSVDGDGTEEGSAPPREALFSEAPNFHWIEACLLTNVFLLGFDATVTASIYTTIGNEFDSVNLASWITTSYLITSTTFQPLYGSFSDVLGRRVCVFFAIATFTVGCIGCSLASSLAVLNVLRAVAGIGGGGLLTLSTVIHSDIIIPRKRGIFQAFQNVFVGLGSVSGASFGGILAESFGWRSCFILQVPLLAISLATAYYCIQDQRGFSTFNESLSPLPARQFSFDGIDVKGSLILITTLTLQVGVLTLGGNEVSWTDWKLVTAAIVAVVLMGWFVYVERKTTATPIIPIKRFHSLFSVLILAQNFFLGFSSLAYLFLLPLLFQFVLGDSPSRVGLRLIVPSFSTPIGSVIVGVMMNKHFPLKPLVYVGTLLMSLGNFLVLKINSATSSALVHLLLIPANLGQGMAYPACLFTFLYAFPFEYQAASTSTIYLLRSIGGVWGVSSIAAIIQSSLKSRLYEAFRDSSETHGYTKKQIRELINSIVKSTDFASALPKGLGEIVAREYEAAIRLAQVFSAIVCTLALLTCVLRDVFNAKCQSRA